VGEAGYLDGFTGCRSPAERARDENVQVSRSAKLHGALDLAFEVVKIGNGRRGDVGNIVSHRDTGKVFALAEGVTGFGSYSLGGGGACGRRSRRRALHAGVHIALVVVTDEEDIVISFEHPRQASKADIDGPAVTRLGDNSDVFYALGPKRGGDAGGNGRALPKSECSQGIRHDVSG